MTGRQGGRTDERATSPGWKGNFVKTVVRITLHNAAEAAAAGRAAERDSVTGQVAGRRAVRWTGGRWADGQKAVIETISLLITSKPYSGEPPHDARTMPARCRHDAGTMLDGRSEAAAAHQ